MLTEPHNVHDRRARPFLHAMSSFLCETRLDSTHIEPAILVWHLRSRQAMRAARARSHPAARPTQSDAARARADVRKLPFMYALAAPRQPFPPHPSSRTHRPSEMSPGAIFVDCTSQSSSDGVRATQREGARFDLQNCITGGLRE